MSHCGAKTRSGGVCKRKAMPNGRCDMHGGKTPAGIASPNFQTGKYSKYLPARMLEKYGEAQSDAELIALREEVALTDSRLADLLGKVDTGESGALWAKLQATWERYVKFKDRTDKQNEANEAFFECGCLIREGVSDHYAWSEISGLIEQRRKLVESESKRLKDMQQVITAEKAMALIATLAGIVKKHVTEPEQLRAISRELVQLTAGESGKYADAA